MKAKWVHLTVVLAILLGIGGGAIVAGEPVDDEYREDLMTLDGRRFFRVRLVKVDPNGLLFRHRDGVAKVTFNDLSEDFREYYGYDETRARDFERRHSGAPSDAAVPAPKPMPASEVKAEPEIVVTYRTRTFIPVRFEDPYACARSACGGVPWYSHWARFDPRLAYARFPCRQLAERDFLISSGIVPAPPGVTVRRLRW